MYYLHREPNGYYTINQEPQLNGIEGEAFETFAAAVYFGRVWQLQVETTNKGKA